jgi:hypothetical protein
MIRPITAIALTKESEDGSVEIIRLSRFEDLVVADEIDDIDMPKSIVSVAEGEEKWLWNANAKRDCHPLLYFRTMMCKKIERVTKTDHDSFELLIHRDSTNNTIVTLDCKTFSNIEINPMCIDGSNTIMFTFEEYFTEDELKELHEIFLSGEYNNLVGVPEY